MKRVAIIGPPGAGKSWLSVRLGEKLGVPVLHLDRHFWRPDWVETPPDEWRAQQLALLDAHAGSGWIADGNFGGTMDLRLERADTLVFLDPNPARAIARILGRELGRGRVGLPLLPRRYDRDFLKFLRYTWRYRRDRRPGVRERLAAFEGDVYVLQTRREVARFLDAL